MLPAICHLYFIYFNEQLLMGGKMVCIHPYKFFKNNYSVCKSGKYLAILFNPNQQNLFPLPKMRHHFYARILTVKFVAKTVGGQTSPNSGVSGLVSKWLDLYSSLSGLVLRSSRLVLKSVWTVGGLLKAGKKYWKS